MNKTKMILAAMLLACTFSQAHAHTVWLEPDAKATNEYWVMFNGHGGKVEAANPEKLKSVEAVDAGGKKLAVARSVSSQGVRLMISGKPVLLALHLDNGIHSRRAEGASIEAPMNEVPGAVRATRALKYHKTIVRWNPRVTRAVGQPFEVIPLDAAEPRAGEPFRVRVLLDGKPIAGVKLGAGEDGGETAPATNADGVAEFTPTSGPNKLWAGKRLPIANNPAYTELSYEYLLGFVAR
jgi:nickel transport protein